MVKKYKPRDLDETQNPFLQELKIGVIDRFEVSVLSDVSKIEQDESSGIITGLGGRTLSESTRYQSEVDRFVVEYSSYGDLDLDEVRDKLSGGALKMYSYIKTCLRKNKTLVHIDRIRYMDKYGISSPTTFASHRDELVMANIITPSASSFQGWYWVNPVFVFNGSRMIAFKDKKVVMASLSRSKKRE